MSELNCYGCETGVVQHHQDGAKSWFACGCGQFTGPKIDMSDARHVERALSAWNDQAAAYTPPAPPDPVEDAHRAMEEAEETFLAATEAASDAEAAWMRAVDDYEVAKDEAAKFAQAVAETPTVDRFEPDKGFDDNNPEAGAMETDDDPVAKDE